MIGTALKKKKKKKEGDNKAKTPLLKQVVKEADSVGRCHLSVYWHGQPVYILNLNLGELNRSKFLFCII